MENDFVFNPNAGYGMNNGLGMGMMAGLQARNITPNNYNLSQNKGWNLGVGNQDPSGTFGMNIPTFQFGMNALNGIGQLFMANKANKLANKQFNFQKDAWNLNVNNAIKDYNTKLSDTARARGAFEGQTQEQMDQYYNDNKMTR